MKQLKSFISVFITLLIILVFVFARTSNKNLFKQDSIRAIEASRNGNNAISSSGLENLSAPYIVINLSNSEVSNTFQSQNIINIPFENLLDKTNQKILNDAEGKIVLYSKDVSIASKAWVILNQLNFENVFILESEEDSEVLKYKFQPDTVAKPE
ncbi:rhodanese-like domain-containing protein [Draconibacterium sp.]|nr:rhodanese-like domain-containing protein [Draconibacterium sp.]